MKIKRVIAIILVSLTIAGTASVGIVAGVLPQMQ